MTNKNSRAQVKYDLTFLNKTNDSEKIRSYLDHQYVNENYSQEFVNYIKSEALVRKTRISERSNTLIARIFSGGPIQFVRSSPSKVLQDCIDWSEEAFNNTDENKEELHNLDNENLTTTHTTKSYSSETEQQRPANVGSFSKTGVKKSYSHTKTHTFVFTANSPVFQGLNKYKLVEIGLFLFFGVDKNGISFFTVNGEKPAQKHFIQFLRLFEVFNYTIKGGIKADGTLLKEIGAITNIHRQVERKVVIEKYPSSLKLAGELQKYIITTDFTMEYIKSFC